ncbi:unnamed protein product [Adineta steineri]|uniref:Uncharacterized protein n=1 Tax=Adineta steineri TaxID=433720 RepID=A0A813RQR4_9BILA|nr:unnamed protein product [Adineta steineri]CAF3678581.1 unnamed protein product [Adineta steineri]
MRTSREFGMNDARNGRNFRDLDDMQPAQPIFLSLDPKYQYDEKPRNDTKRQVSKSGRSDFCAKACVIGLGIGLLIGAVAVVVVAVPVALVNRSTSRSISSTPYWTGTYQTDGSCILTQCCCFANQIILSQQSSSVLQLTGNVTGVCPNVAPSIILTQALPTGFQMFLSWSSQIIRVQLSQDSSFISLVNLGAPICSIGALRSSYGFNIMESTNISLILFLLFISTSLKVNDRM